MQYYKGLDSRYWDGVLPAGYDDGYFKYAGIKISQGTKDNLDLSAPKKQWALAPAQGLDRLPFHFWKGSTLGNPEQHGIAQAEFFFEMMVKLDPNLGELPPCVDAEDKWARKGRNTLIDICACAKRTKELWGKHPLIYTARWWWDSWVTPWDNYDRSKYDPYIYDLWEADPPPDTKEPGDWELQEDQPVIIQVQLDVAYPGFNAKIDVDWADPNWYDKQVGTTPPQPPAEKTEVEVHYTKEEAEIKLVEKI